ncbi:reverse transcriptase domain-containing protein [Tanacetum coccineum]
MVLWTINAFRCSKYLSGGVARQDLKRLGIRSGLWLGQKNEKCSKPQATYSFTPEDRKKFCQFIKGVKLPDGFGSNFKHKVTDNDTNITGLKSHDCHIMMQRLLPYGLQQYLPPDVAKPLIELCLFFKQICSQTLMVDDMLKAQSKVIDILCNLELIYPPAFFDIMIHLVIHLPLEAIFGGPIRPRWMYPFERYMKKLKNYVRNKAKPEGSIAEGYVAEEALTFSSHYFRDVTTKFNRPDRNVDCPPPTCQFQVFKSLCKSIGLRSVIRIDHQELKKVIWYVLHNSPEIDTYRAKFKIEFPNKDMKEEFPGWFGKQIRQRHVDNDPGVNESSELFALACGPSQTPISVNSCVVNGVRFVVHSRDERRTTQNSGICSPGPDGEMYYGQLEQILEFSYLSFKTVLFRVKWFDTSNKGRIQNFVIRNNITQIKANGEAFKNDQYILATQVKQCFYLEDMARRPLGWKVVEHVSHKKFLNGGVIVVEDDPDVIHVDNSSDLALSTSLNDLEIAALHIDGQSIDVDAPPDIIDVVDEDDDIIDEEDPIPHDLADSDDEDLVNLDIDDGVNVMSADVARGHGGDGGGDDRPPPYQVPTGCGGCLGNRGKGTRKPNLGGRRAGRPHTRQETRNLGLKAITDKSGPVPIRFEVNDRETLMPLGDHAAHWANYLGELVRELPLHYPSWRQMSPERKAGVVAKIGTQFDLRPHMESDRWPQIYAGIQQHLQKIYNGKKAALKERYWVPEEDGTYDLERLRRGRPSHISEVNWDAQLAFWNDPKNLARAAQNKQNRAKSKVMETSATREYPSLIHTFFLTHTVGGVFLNPEDKALYDEMLRLQGLGSNTPTGVPYTKDEIMAIVRGGKQRGHIPGVGRVLPGQGTVIPPPSQSTHFADIARLKKREKRLTKQVNMFMRLFRSDDKFSQMLNQFESQPEYGGGSGSGGCGDDEPGDDEDDGEDEDDS